MSRTLTPAEVKAYANLAQAARRLREAQKRAQRQDSKPKGRAQQ